MPNWCNNFVQISHEDTAKIEALAAAVRDGGFCKHVVPVPEDLNIVAGRVGDDTDPDQIELERREKENLEKYGYSTWYDFCVNEWGTKWDIDAYDPEEVIVDGNSIHFGFDSAWAPPIGIYAKLADMGFTVDAMYYEPGMAFCGRWYDGNDEYWDIGGMDSETVSDAIDPDINEHFGISECMAEYEEQERMDEELYKFVKEGGEAKGLELKVNE